MRTIEEMEIIIKGESNREGELEHKLMMLGYNQAMLDYAQFPIMQEDQIIITREEVEKIVAKLKDELGMIA